MRPTLRRRVDFDLVYAKGRKTTCPALVLFHLASAPDQRVAFVASRRVGIAVERNRAKRLMRAGFADVERSTPALAGWIVLVARRDILTHKSMQVAAQLQRMLGACGCPPDAGAA